MADRERAGLPARRAAGRLLHQVLRQGRALDEAFHDACVSGPLEGFAPRDRAHVRLLAATVLRRLGQIDDALGRFLEKPLPSGSGPAREILLVGAAQLLFLDTPPHAAIDLAVRCADADRKARPFKGLVNAVLRRLSESAKALLAEQDAPRLNTPDWLWARWQAAYGGDLARAIAAAHLAEAPLDLTPRADPRGTAERLGATLLPTGSLRLEEAGAIQAIPGYADGEWWVQDAAAALPARLLGDVSGRRVLDLCAAPGGKTAQLAAAGADVTAIDRSGARLQIVARNLERLRLKAQLIEADAATYAPEAPAPFILLDAPCSATGTLRRHPDIARTREEGAIAELAAVQARLLDHAVSLLPAGGVLVYSTCSLEPEEGEAQIAALLERGAPLVRRPVAAREVAGLAHLLTPQGDLRTLPCHGIGESRGLDGFFAARLVKA